jgi:hypothetical protein
VLFGVNAQLESEGNPTQLYVSAWLKPFVGVTVMLADPLCPGVTVMEGTLGASEKPGTPVTVSVIWIVLIDEDVPPVDAVIVIGVLLATVDAPVAMLSAIVVCVVLFGVKVQLAPEGNPEHPKVSDWLKPLAAVTVIVAEPVCPATTVTVAGFEAMLNAGVTTSVTGRVLLTGFVPPLVAVMVSVLLLEPIDASVVTVNVTVSWVVLFGEKLHVAPVGNPEQLKVSALLKPVAGATVIVAVPFCPAIMFRVETVDESVKAGATVTVAAVEVEFESAPSPL